VRDALRQTLESGQWLLSERTTLLEIFTAS